jgi:hypothetical protein
MAETNTTRVQAVAGWNVKSVSLKAPKNDEGEDLGTIQVVLEASKSDVRSQGKTIGEIITSLNIHNSDLEPVALQLRF